MMDIGKNVMLGLAIGIDRNSSSVMASMDKSADDTVRSAKSTFGQLANVLGDMDATDPVITPVLDLTNVKKEAGKIADMTNVVPITAALSSNQAAAISNETAALDSAAADVAASQAAPVLEYNQTITSPKALSEIEIYRQTKNGLSQAKSMLAGSG